jgi:hypothetical protein
MRIHPPSKCAKHIFWYFAFNVYRKSKKAFLIGFGKCICFDWNKYESEKGFE